MSEKKFENIAIVRTDKLGDMILTLPMVKAVRIAFPNSYVSLIARNYVAPLVENQDFIDKIIYTDDYTDGIKEIFGSNRFDLIFFPRPRFNECLAAFIHTKALRVGSAYRWYSFLFNKKIRDHRKNAQYHEAEYNVRMVEAITGRKLPTNLVPPHIESNSIDKILSLLSENQVQPGDFIVIHPGSGGSARDWSKENFALLAKFLAEEKNQKIIVTGSTNEATACSFIAGNSANIIDLSGKLSTKELIALISVSKLLIANSTGVIHIAASYGIKVVGFYPNSPHLSYHRWGPYTDNAKIFTPPLSKNKKDNDNMDLISFEEVKMDSTFKVEFI